VTVLDSAPHNTSVQYSNHPMTTGFGATRVTSRTAIIAWLSPGTVYRQRPTLCPLVLHPRAQVPPSCIVHRELPGAEYRKDSRAFDRAHFPKS
jgi:hypothetical protein